MQKSGKHTLARQKKYTKKNLTWRPLSKPRGRASSSGCFFLGGAPSSPLLILLFPKQTDLSSAFLLCRSVVLGSNSATLFKGTISRDSWRNVPNSPYNTWTKYTPLTLLCQRKLPLTVRNTLFMSCHQKPNPPRDSPLIQIQLRNPVYTPCQHTPSLLLVSGDTPVHTKKIWRSLYYCQGEASNL